MKKILLIDDYEPTAITLQFLCESAGHDCTYETSGKKALALGTTDFELILVDIHLPHTSGIELSPLLREKWPHAKIVGYTADPDLLSADEKKAFDGVENKNLDAKAVERLFEKWLN